ncbi:hypothetical protein [Lonepinella sp. BR2271]|uniref:hypothetical protein n=1 Tax=Lonepinella sp. BR2271 TaxID=3434550 RepID=UPI003F6E302C
MSKNTEIDKGYFDDFDIEHATIIQHPLVAKVQTTLPTQLLEKDVSDWLQRQPATKIHQVNELIRNVMLLAS